MNKNNLTNLETLKYIRSNYSKNCCKNNKS